ncbi:hypothetical protein PUN28_000038 [Cardiocondyla obscurior]|uniref:Uncharacterized protein n=1 Tax=Cardiocondyla obscurior TaxID=286306 RepID=A0AAW2GXV3_9HYME
MLLQCNIHFCVTGSWCALHPRHPERRRRPRKGIGRRRNNSKILPRRYRRYKYLYEQQPVRRSFGAADSYRAFCYDSFLFGSVEKFVNHRQNTSTPLPCRSLTGHSRPSEVSPHRRRMPTPHVNAPNSHFNIPRSPSPCFLIFPAPYSCAPE